MYQPKDYKLKAVLITSGGKLSVDCKMAKDGCVDGTFTDKTGSWTKEFIDYRDVREYIHKKLQTKNIITMTEVIG